MDAIDRLEALAKGAARGGKYYKRVPTGKPKRPWKYYYTKEQYEREHQHIGGDDAKRKAYLSKLGGTQESFEQAIKQGKIKGSLASHMIRARKVKESHDKNLKRFMGELTAASPPGAKVKARVKTTESILGKMLRKPKYAKGAHTLQDITGSRIVCNSISEVKSTVAKLKAKYKVVEEDNYIDTPQGDYRSHHLIVEDSDGNQKEVQVRTGNQDVFADWAHDIYKPMTPQQEAAMNSPQNKSEIEAYSKAASDFLFREDSGEKTRPPYPPPCPTAAKNAFGCLSFGG